MSFLDPVTLTGDLVRLEPLGQQHHDGLVRAVRDGELWDLFYTQVPRPEQMRAEIDRRLKLHAEGRWLPFATLRTDGTVIGMTSYLNVEPAHRHVEIGSTWNALSAQRSGTNTESKLLLLTHAFETLGCIAVEFRTHWLNQQSRAAISRLGAKQDGVLRQHQVMPDGTLRDTAVFSIIDSEWPAIRKELRRRLARGAAISGSARTQ